MHAVRHLFGRRPAATAALLVAALLLRLLVPVGFMPVAAAHGIALAACPDGGLASHATAHRGAQRHPGHPGGYRHGEGPCAFAGLGLPTLAGGAVPLLSPAPAITPLARSPRARSFRFRSAARERPPAHAPPTPG